MKTYEVTVAWQGKNVGVFRARYRIPATSPRVAINRACAAANTHYPPSRRGLFEVTVKEEQEEPK